MKPRFTYFALCLAAFMAYTATSAQAASYSEKKLAFDTLYASLLANPSDVDLNLQYAELAVEIGDYEAAIAPLERLLLANPNEPKLKLELGVLYYQLGSFDTARNYLNQAKVSASNNPEISAQADEYLKKL